MSNGFLRALIERDFMRMELSKRDGLRTLIRATFERFGRRRGWDDAIQSTLLIRNVTDAQGNVLCDHLWIDDVSAFVGLGLRAGDVVTFSAQVDSYWRGIGGRFYPDRRQLDYRLICPLNVRKVDN